MQQNTAYLAACETPQESHRHDLSVRVPSNSFEFIRNLLTTAAAPSFPVLAAASPLRSSVIGCNPSGIAAAMVRRR